MFISRSGRLIATTSTIALCTLISIGALAQDTPLEPDNSTGEESTEETAPKTATKKAVTPTKKVSAPVKKEATPKAITKITPKTTAPAFSPFVFSSELKGDETIPKDRWRLSFGGYIRLLYTGIQNDDNAPLIGRNDGFVLGNARPTFTGEMSSGLGFRLQFETAANLDAPNTLTPSREMIVRPRDTYLFYKALPFLELQLGQFKPPHDLEALLSTADLAFINRSVGSSGVPQFADVRPQVGLSIDRQIGAQVLGKYFFTSDDNKAEGIGLGYALAVTNGTSSNQTVNDNDSLAYYGRLSVHWGDMVTLGGGFYLNDLLNGTPPDQIVITRTGWTADLLVNAYGVHLMGSINQQKEDTNLFTDSNPSSEKVTFNTAMAYQFQVGYRIPVINVMPSVRYAFYDPTATFNEVDVQDPGLDARDVDALTYITLGLSYVPETYPISVMLNYTLAGEQDGAESLNNDRFDAMVQLTW